MYSCVCEREKERAESVGQGANERWVDGMKLLLGGKVSAAIPGRERERRSFYFVQNFGGVMVSFGFLPRGGDRL